MISHCAATDLDTLGHTSYGKQWTTHLFFDAHEKQPCQTKQSLLHVADKLLTLVITS